MNKINVIITESDNLEGCYNLKSDDLNKVINGTCPEIICGVLDSYSYKDRVSNIVSFSKKLSNSGFLTLKFINATKICKDVSRGNSSSQFLSTIVAQSQSLFLDSDMIELVSQMDGIKIHKIYNDNSHVIVVLQKKI
ncbi:MAG: hypothetical protein WD512_11985 [Candidatus Paceibacterota bacterium]